MKIRSILIALAVVFVASLALVFLFRYLSLNFAADLAAIPAIGALFGALYELALETVKHQHAVALEDVKNRFTVGATSHMADVAFDKHVEFCEKYVAKMEETLKCLYSKGPTEQVLPLATELFQIRRAATLWLTDEIQHQLSEYETTIIRIGNHSKLANQFPDWPDRPKYVQEMFTLYSEIVGDKEDTKGNPTKGDVATAKIIGHLKDVLGISELTALRSELIRRASAAIGER